MHISKAGRWTLKPPLISPPGFSPREGRPASSERFSQSLQGWWRDVAAVMKCLVRQRGPLEKEINFRIDCARWPPSSPRTNMKRYREPRNRAGACCQGGSNRTVPLLETTSDSSRHDYKHTLDYGNSLTQTAQTSLLMLGQPQARAVTITQCKSLSTFYGSECSHRVVSQTLCKAFSARYTGV